jgi:hypothetical protein
VEPSASIFREKCWALYHPEGGGNKLLRMIGNCVPVGTASYSRQFRTSWTPLWEHQVSQLLNLICLFLGTFAYSRKEPVSFVMSVRPSVSMYQLSSHWTCFREISCWWLYENLSRNYRFDDVRTKMSDDLREDLNVFCCCRRCIITIQAMLLATVGVPWQNSQFYGIVTLLALPILRFSSY